MRVRASLRRLRRGPVRTAVRDVQRGVPLLAGRRRPGPPDYVGIGVQRCGTSWWQSLIEAHPGVTPLGHGMKELHFFDDLWQRDLTSDDVQRYHAQFLRRPGQRCGEWTPRYLHDPWAVPALLRAAPDARLLIMVRDPVARFRSALRHAQGHGWTIDADLVTDAYQRGCYAGQVRRVLDLVPATQLLLLQLEACAADPAPALRRTFDFLGLPALDLDLRGQRNATEAREPAESALIAEIRARYRADVEELAALVPAQVDLGLWTDTLGARSER